MSDKEETKFPELTQRQREYLKKYFEEQLAIKICLIENSLEFFDGLTNTIYYSFMEIKRVGLKWLSVKTKAKELQFPHAKVLSELNMDIEIPPD